MALITTTKGLMPTEALQRRVNYHEDANEAWTATEYYDGEELVHRSVALHLKQVPAGLEAVLQAFGG